MRRLVAIGGKLIMIALVVSSCSSRKGTSRYSKSHSPYVKDESKTVQKPSITNNIKKQEEDDYTANLTVKNEKVKVIDGNKGDDSHYYAIVGSFKILENAQNLKKQLLENGYKPTILESEIGFYRVAVAGGNDEYQIRKKILELKAHSAENSDAWLLIQQYD